MRIPTWDSSKNLELELTCQEIEVAALDVFLSDVPVIHGLGRCDALFLGLGIFLGPWGVVPIIIHDFSLQSRALGVPREGVGETPQAASVWYDLGRRGLPLRLLNQTDCAQDFLHPRRCPGSPAQFAESLDEFLSEFFHDPLLELPSSIWLRERTSFLCINPKCHLLAIIMMLSGTVR